MLARFFLPFLICIALLSCKGNIQKETSKTENVQPLQNNIPAIKPQPGKLIEKVSLASNPLESYALYVPSSYQVGKTYPLILFFDPHGSGSYPVSLYRSWAEEFGFILAGSNDSKNGLDMQVVTGIGDRALDDIITRLPVNQNMISLCGFSGGARVASQIASRRPEVSYLAMSGATQPFATPSHKLMVLIFAGNEDMNYTDLIAASEQFNKDAYSYSHLLLEFSGKHAWPDTSTMRELFYSVLLNGMKDKGLKKDEELIAKYKAESGSKLKARSSYRLKINFLSMVIQELNGLADISYWQKQLEDISKLPAHKKEFEDWRNSFLREQQLKQYYGPLIGQKENVFWVAEVNKLSHPVNASDKPMFQRVLGYLSLAGYSYSNRAIQAGDFSLASSMLDFYKTVDPTNPDQPYLTALMYAKLGDKKNCLRSLNAAKALGMIDFSKVKNDVFFSLMNDVPEYQTLIQTH